jgi:DNA polymerase III sliding clamp (beta) subunit (PCNA family)
MTMFYIKAKEAKQIPEGLTFCMSKEASRPYLNGVYIHNQGKNLYAVATDGHRIGRLWLDPYGTDGTAKGPLKGDFGFVMPREAVEWLGNMNLSRQFDIEQVRFEVSDDKVKLTLVPNQHSAVFDLVDCTYPDYERVIPSKRGDREVGFNSRYLADLGKAAEKVTGRKGAAVKLHVGSPSDPCVVTCDNERLLYVQMPVRV